MSLHPTTDELHLYHEREMPRDERIAVSEHLSGCAACTQRYVRAYGDPMRALKLLLELPEEPPDIHLDFDTEIVPFVKGELSRLDHFEVEQHISCCAPCAYRVADFLVTCPARTERG